MLGKRDRRKVLRPLREAIVREVTEHADDQSFPVKPQKIVWNLRQTLAPEDIVISDVGAHKMWVGRMYQAERPNTCIISNGFASMGIAVPGRSLRSSLTQTARLSQSRAMPVS